MTAAFKQFFRDLVDVFYDGALASGRVALASAKFTIIAIRVAIGVALLLAIPAAVIWGTWLEPPEERAASDHRVSEHWAAVDKADESKRFLCHAASACKKYDEARLECATAGNFKTCLRLKMGDDAYHYADMCSGGDIGASAKPLPSGTPNAFECFFLTLGALRE